jgi:biopolymer transport protein ExbD
MAELGESGDVHKGRGKNGEAYAPRKHPRRIDMTPMVDLGFLLVTFFILTTTMQKPKAMQVVMPDKDTTNVDKTKIRASEAMIIILGANDKVFYYFPTDSAADAGPQIEVTNFKNVRKLIIDRNTMVHGIQHQKGWKDNGVYILIKPTDDSKYQNMVDMLDEMKITQIKSYALVDITPQELEMIPK